MIEDFIFDLIFVFFELIVGTLEVGCVSEGNNAIEIVVSKLGRLKVSSLDDVIKGV